MMPEPTPPDAGRGRLDEAFASPDAKQAYVRRLFATIAGRYDLITVLLSYGQDHRWKRRLAAMSGAAAGTRVLDLACGTGDIAHLLAARGARVTGLDVTHEMLRRARTKGPGVAFVSGDMMALPFPNAHFDVVTAGYGIRNVPELVPALAEIRRVLRPGGVFLSLDFNRPANPIVRGVYLGYLAAVGSVLGAVLHRDPDTYRYIPASIRRYPGAPRVCRLLIEQGFERCTYIPVLGGLMAIHRAS
jgi:ubiquinone/menaquinone biosynthesis methyltransferase